MTTGSDTDTDTDADTDDPSTHDDHFIEGGGSTGGPVDGLFVMWLVDDPGGDPIAGARVMIVDDEESAVTGETDDDGRVVFEDASLEGPLDVHVLAEGYPAGSLFGVDATYVTIERQRSDHDPACETVTLAGTADGMGNVPDPSGPGIVKMAIVRHGLPIEELESGEYEEIEQEEVDGKPVNVVVPASGSLSWSLETYTATGALWGIAGLMDTSAQVFTATHLALAPGFDPQADSGEDPVLEFSIPLEETLEIALQGGPDGVEILRATALCDLGEDGSVAIPSLSTGASTATQLFLPDLDAAPLSDAGIEIIVFGALDDEDDETSCGRIYRGDDLVPWPGSLAVDDMFGWPTDLLFDGQSLAVTMPAGIDHFSVVATDEQEREIWTAAVWAPPADTVPLPPFPEDWGFEGIPSQDLELEASAIAFDGDINEMVFDDIRDSLTGFSEGYLSL